MGRVQSDVCLSLVLFLKNHFFGVLCLCVFVKKCPATQLFKAIRAYSRPIKNDANRKQILIIRFIHKGDKVENSAEKRQSFVVEVLRLVDEIDQCQVCHFVAQLVLDERVI